MTKKINAEMAWFMKYRPITSNDYIFENDEHKSIVENIISNKIIPGNLLLSGSPGTGKSSIIQILLKVLNPENHELNVRKIESRKIDSLDNSISWFSYLPNGNCSKKICIIEEIDKCSSSFIGTLKDGLMEKYQNVTCIIATTNYISKLDDAILRRFNYKLEFTNKCNVNERMRRCKFILESENINYNENELLEFINVNSKENISNLITYLQAGSQVNNRFNPLSELINNGIVNNDNYKIINLTKNIFVKFINGTDIEKEIILKQINTSVIQSEWKSLTELLNMNYKIDYNDIFLDLFEYYKYKYPLLIPNIQEYWNKISSNEILSSEATYLAFVITSLNQINI